MNTGWNSNPHKHWRSHIINLLGNEYWLELGQKDYIHVIYYKPTGK